MAQLRLKITFYFYVVGNYVLLISVSLSPSYTVFSGLAVESYFYRIEDGCDSKLGIIFCSTQYSTLQRYKIILIRCEDD